MLKKYWTLPELRHVFFVSCELKRQNVVLTLSVNTDNKSERVTEFKSVRVIEKTTGEAIMSHEAIPVVTSKVKAEGSHQKASVAEAIKLTESVGSLAGDGLRVEGTLVIAKKLRPSN